MEPMMWGGSGGSSFESEGGNGGGGLRIIVGKVIENNGLITANGQNCGGDWGYGGGGAGGSVWITVTGGGLFGTGTFLSRADAARMRQTWISSPAQGGDILPLLLCSHCSPVSHTPPHPYP